MLLSYEQYSTHSNLVFQDRVSNEIAKILSLFQWSGEDITRGLVPVEIRNLPMKTSNTGRVFVNGKFCNNTKLAVADDFFSSSLNMPRNTLNPVGSKVTIVNVDQIPGLNIFGISLVRIDYALYGGLNPPHTHPCGIKILVVMEGTLYVGFVTSNPENRFVTKVLNPGDVFVFPIGLIHFQFNKGKLRLSPLLFSTAKMLGL
ncbi:Cupin 1 - like 10 [Theobroma cacao]|nr:Cupin 1 - like 10 [Theobroma cacao]